MNVAELERLVASVDMAWGRNAKMKELENMAPSLARRVIAAEKLVESGKIMADAVGAGVASSTHVTDWDNLVTAYEATK